MSMTLEQDIDEQIRAQEQIVSQVAGRIAEIQPMLQQLHELSTGARYAITILKAIKLKNAVKAPEPAPDPASHDGPCTCESSPPGFVAKDQIHCGYCGGVVRPSWRNPAATPGASQS
jgi:hypothetical protein